MKQCRETFAQVLFMLQAANQELPEQEKVLQYFLDFVLLQANGVVSWRCTDEQLERARTAQSLARVSRYDDFAIYKSKLQSLRVQSAEEAFQAARRVARLVSVSPPSVARCRCHFRYVTDTLAQRDHSQQKRPTSLRRATSSARLCHFGSDYSPIPRR